MQETVQSTKTEAKKEYIIGSLETQQEFRFNCSRMAGELFDYSNPELLCVWYAQILSEFEDSLEYTLKSPINGVEGSTDEALETLRAFTEDIVQSASKNLDADISPAVEMKNAVQRFREGEVDELTVSVIVNGNNCTVGHMNGFLETKGVLVDMNGEPDTEEEASLREHASEIPDQFNSYSPYDRRPLPKYRRELYLSYRRNESGVQANVIFDETRVKPPTLMERLANYISSILG